MSDQRCVAELIGWQWSGRSWWPTDVSYSDGSPPHVDDMLAWLHSRGWEMSHAWVNHVGEHAGQITVQFKDPNKYPPEERATWPADRFNRSLGKRSRTDPIETGRGWWNFTGPTLLDIFEQAVRKAAEGAA